ncbi:MAG: hypothetical protein MJ082_05130 [Clostridia bacterium]|nr:hypothetical protein [Clostridia bacterium]
MKIKHLNPSERLSLFKSLYEKAKNRYREELIKFDRHLAQYRGSSEIDGSTERASAVRNITYEIIESQVSSDIPTPKVDAACYSEERDRCAKSVERLLSAVRDRLSFEEMNDLDERFTYIYGGSVWLVEWENETRLADEIGSVKITCLPPKSLIPEPGMTEIDGMDYCFLRFPASRSELGRRYGISDEELAKCAADTDMEADTDDGDIATEILCFYRDEEGEVGRFAFSGDLTLSDLPNYYMRKRKVCKKCGKPEGECLCESPIYELVNQRNERIGASEADLPSLTIPYYVPRSFPLVIRKNTSLERSLFGQSDCEYLRPEQQAINKIESRILQKLLRAGITPIVPEDATIVLNNSVFGQVIKMKPSENPAQYGKVDTTPDISQDIAEAERLYVHAKRIMGISDAYVGISESKSESGYARQLQISQASGRLESKRKMKFTAYADLDRLIFEHYLAFADEPRRLSFRDAYGRIHNADFNRVDFLFYDRRAGEYRYDDGYLFSVDLNGGIEGQRNVLWEKNLENLKCGALGDPSSDETLLRYWQAQERAHYPFARENVEYFLSRQRGEVTPFEQDAFSGILPS